MWNLFLVVVMAQSCFITCQLYEYLYVGENKSWSEAQQYCRKHHTDLATVANTADMKRLISHKPENTNETWIGLFNQTKGTRTWHWSTYGEDFNDSQTRWSKTNNEPDDNNIENCGFIYKDLTWGDISCIRVAENICFLCFNDSKTSERFYLIYQKVTWLEAQRYCRENHTDLVSGWNQTRDTKLTQVLNYLPDHTYPYIGMFKDAWRWSDGSSFSFRYWNLNLSDELVYSKDRCAMVVFNDGGRWMNDDCDEQKPFFCYEDKVILIREKMNWEEALYYCRDHYHDLVTITNPDDQRWVQEKVKDASTPYVWMGLRYTCTLDFWFWVSDEVVSYKNWVSGGPENDCDMSGAMDTGGQHQWVTKNDEEKFNFICSK